MSDLRKLPRVDVLSETPDLAGFPRKVRVEAARAALTKLRTNSVTKQSPEELALQEAQALTTSTFKHVINASGVILHTGLGRARLAPEAAEAAQKAADHINLELDLQEGKRGDRQDHVRALLKQLTGAEDAYIVNNGAAALFLVLHALAKRKEVILSRGQMVEIGGSFRINEIVKQSGGKLVEIGTTNKTRLSDYEQAVSLQTAAILRCHPSNFRVVGFTEEVLPRDLAGLAHRSGAVLIDDVGSGCLVDTTNYGLPKEPTLQEALQTEADIVTASGDKMLGGPQAGIILGRKELIARIKRDPIARVVRIDKLSLSALEATLRLYSTGQEERIPTLKYLSRTPQEVKIIAEELQHAYGGEAVVERGITEVGGGSLPGTGVPSFRVGLRSASPNNLARKLRLSQPPVLSRIEDNLVWLDPRTLEPNEVDALKSILRNLP